MTASSSGPEFAYIDETGDTGAFVAGGSRSGSKSYSLGCLLVPMTGWTGALDDVVQMRRGISTTYGVRMAVEAKANELVGIKKTYRDLGLGDGQVRDIYQRHVDSVAAVSSGVGAIVIDKSKIRRPDIDVFSTAWEYLFTRLRKRAEDSGHPIVVVHDKGEEDRVRRHLRRFRRLNWQGTGVGNAPLLIEDAVPRDSRQSYFIQMADLVAYSASRYAIPTTGRTTKICDQTMWQRMSSVHMTQLNRARGDGIYVWPT